MAHTSEVEVLPLYYEAAGKVHSSRLYLTELAIVANLNAPQLAAEALTGPMTPPGQRVQTLNPPGSEVGPGRVATWGKATVNRVEALGLKWEADGKSSKHIPFDWSGPEQG